MLDWLIIGGGPHGVHVAVRLIAEAGLSPEQIRILDPAPELLARWKAFAAITGMTHLRSPSVHHLDLDPWSLQRFAGNRKRRPAGLFAYPYDRPSLSLFNRHSDSVVVRHGLAALHIRESAARLVASGSAVRVDLAGGGDLASRCVVLAVGAGDQPEWPSWAGRPGVTPHVRHVFDRHADLEIDALGERVAVVGGGLTVVQVALRLMREERRVEILARHPIREHQFDSDPGWLGPRFLSGYGRERDPARRRNAILQARHRGSLPPDAHRALRQSVAAGRLCWTTASIGRLDAAGPSLSITLDDGGRREVDQILLATGFAQRRPGGRLVDGLIRDLALPTAPCGYPVTDRRLCWHPRIFVTGPLAELELGPVARNLAGARHAAVRIAAYAAASSTPPLYAVTC